MAKFSNRNLNTHKYDSGGENNLLKNTDIAIHEYQLKTFLNV